MNKYHDGEVKKWFDRMFDAGWRFWIWTEPGIMWRHADEPVQLTIKESQDYFKQFVNTKGQYIPTPYEIQDSV